MTAGSPSTFPTATAPPGVSATSTASAVPTGPFEGTPAAQYPEAETGVTLPAGTAVPGFTAEQVNARLQQVKQALVASRLDPAMLITDAGRLESTAIAARFAAVDAARLQSLYRSETNVSLKAVQTAQAALIEAQSQARAAAVNFALQWGPVAGLADAPRRGLLEALL